jgi:hypothetical protein
MRASEEDVASTLSETVQFIIADTGPFTIAGYTGDEDTQPYVSDVTASRDNSFYMVVRDPRTDTVGKFKVSVIEIPGGSDA